MKYVRDIVEWPIYLTIGNLSHEIKRSQIRVGKMIVDLIFIHKEDSFKIKIEIYH